MARLSPGMTSLRDLPSVDRLLQQAGDLLDAYGRPMTTDAIRLVLEQTREDFDPSVSLPGENTLLEQAAARLKIWTAPTLQPVINATGVIIHTNLGRAPLSGAAVEAMRAVTEGYSNLEFDLARGSRGSRYTHAEDLIRRITGAEAALVVNNNAAAVLLVLRALANRRRVLISRTQLIEIGGGFRIPDIMKQSGALLVEIGATNRVHLQDYAQAIADMPIALVLSAHRSNFQLVGFTAEPDRAALAALAAEHSLPYVEDLGSGTFLDTARFGLAHEPTVQESLQDGVDLVTFSGDKLLGGPQAGIIAGRAHLVARLKKNPLARALRADKSTYAGLSATLLHYARDEALEKIPVWRMIAADRAGLQARVQSWARSLENTPLEGQTALVEGESTVGGGSLPGQTLPTTLLGLEVSSTNRWLSALRNSDPPIVARAAEGRLLLDPRTVFPEQDRAVLDALAHTAAELL